MREVSVNIDPNDYQRRFFKERKRLDGLYCGRGVGKTFVLVTSAALALINGEKIIYLTPTTSLLRKDIMKRIVNTLSTWGIPYSYNKTESSIEVGEGVLYGASFENYDEALRGLDGVSSVLIDEIAKANNLEDLFACVSPTMRHTKFSPRTLYASTPRKGSQCDKWVKEGRLGDPVVDVTIDDNDKVTEEERENMKAFLSGSLYDQEILGKIIDGDVEQAVFPRELFGKKFISPRGIPSLGIDCAGAGRDYNVFYVVDDVHIIEKVKIQQADTFQLAAVARQLCSRHGVKLVTIDGTGGFGQGLFDMLKIDKGLQVISVNFGQAAMDSENFANARAEMYFMLAKAMKEGFSVDEDEVTEQMRIVSFFLTPTGRSQLIPKEAIKKVLGCSPDSADALALAYYMRRKMQNFEIRKNGLYKSLRMF